MNNARFLLLFLLFATRSISTYAQDCADKVERKGIDNEQITDSRKSLLIAAVERLASDSALKHGQVGLS